MSGLIKGNGLPSNPIVLMLATLDSPPVYNAVANLGDITGPTRQRQTTKVTAHGDLAERIVGTLLAEGSISGTMFFIPAAGQVASHTDPTNGVEPIFERNDLRAWAIYYNDTPGTARFFNAYVTKLSEKAPVAGVLTKDFELSIDNTMATGTAAGGPSTAVFAPPEA
jgi:hypothetical protein